MEDRLLKYLSEAFLPYPPQGMGVAVSGGSDSMALLYLLHAFCQDHQIELKAVTVDHGLRPEAAQEAAEVARQCAEIGVPHDVLTWTGWTGEGNLQGAARAARYQLMAEWGAQNGIETIAVGHTADDQAETVLMRLSRRSGVDGLAGMSPRTMRDGINWVRPLLRCRRTKLRDYLTSRDIPWVDDPSNEDDRFDRIKVRKALEVLTPLGIDTDTLGEVAEHMALARKALDWNTFLAAKRIVTMESGAVVLDEALLKLQPDEVQRRLMIKAITWVSGSIYAPRRGAIAAVKTSLQDGQAATVDGCHIRRIASNLWFFREYNAVRASETATDVPWDVRWRLNPINPAIHTSDLSIRAVGLAGLEQCPNWRATRRPHVVLQSTPGVWRGDQLVAAPMAGLAQNWKAEFGDGPDTFFASLLSH